MSRHICNVITVRHHAKRYVDALVRTCKTSLISGETPGTTVDPWGWDAQNLVLPYFAITDSMSE